MDIAGHSTKFSSPSNAAESTAMPSSPVQSSSSSVIHRRYLGMDYAISKCSARQVPQPQIDLDSLTLMEQVVLLGLNDKQGHLSFFNDSLSYVLRGCILIELALKGRIQTIKSYQSSRLHPSERHIEAVELDTPTGDPILDEALRLISTESHSISTWIDLLSGESWNPLKINLQIKQLRERISKGLVDKGILGTNKKTICFFLEMATHPIISEGRKIELVNELRRELLGYSDYPSKLSIGIIGASALAGRVLHPVLSSLSFSQRRIAIQKASKWLKELAQDDASKSDIITGVFSVFHRMDSPASITAYASMLTISIKELENKECQNQYGHDCQCLAMVVPQIDERAIWPRHRWVVIGEGKSSTVYQVSSDKALKIHHGSCRAFCTEAMLLWKCKDCPWVVDIYGAGSIAIYRHCILLELMVENAMQKFVYNFKPRMAAKRYIELCLTEMVFDVLKALEFLNDKLKIGHGDISPKNILCSGNGYKLADFEEHAPEKPTGTLRFMAPEFFSDGNTFSSPFAHDIWSLGKTVTFIYDRILEKNNANDFKLTASRELVSERTDYHGTDFEKEIEESELDIITEIMSNPIYLDFEDEQLSGLVELMLQRDPSRRPSAKRLLLHPVFKDLRPRCPFR